jgi:O-acetyl-ADP-ribose deacetylase (regulator of RNase III)
LSYSELCFYNLIILRGSMRLYVEKSKTIGSVTANVGLGDLTEAKADAYIVPQFNSCASEGGVGAAICRAGAQLGVIDEYEGIVRNAGGTVEFGKAFVTAAHGGNTEKLIHVVSVGSGHEREYKVVHQAIYNALVAAKAAAIKSIVCPVLGTGIIGALTDEQSAKAMLSAVQRFDRDNRDSGIQVTFVAYGNPQNTNHPTFRTLKNVLTQETYKGASPVVGVREFDPERFRTELQRDIDLGTTPREPEGGPARPSGELGDHLKSFTRKPTS